MSPPPAPMVAPPLLSPFVETIKGGNPKRLGDAWQQAAAHMYSLDGDSDCFKNA